MLGRRAVASLSPSPPLPSPPPPHPPGRRRCLSGSAAPAIRPSQYFQCAVPWAINNAELGGRSGESNPRQREGS
eukprot:62298-Pyramimonas_sp.AAC.1